jgi:hypothetical protein
MSDQLQFHLIHIETFKGQGKENEDSKQCLNLQHYCQWTLQYQFPGGNTDVSYNHTLSRHDLHSQHPEPIQHKL